MGAFSNLELEFRRYKLDVRNKSRWRGSEKYLLFLLRYSALESLVLVDANSTSKFSWEEPAVVNLVFRLLHNGLHNSTEVFVREEEALYE